MSTATATFRAVADFSDLRKQASATRREFDQLASSQPKLASSVRSTTRAIADQQTTITRAGTAVSNANQKMAGSMRAVTSTAGGTRQAINGVAQAASNMLSSVSPAAGALSSMAASLGTVASAATAAAVTLGALGAGVAALGISFLATREQALTAFTTILKDGAKAEDLLQRITKTAAETPFETNTLVDSTRKLLAFGFSIEQVLSGAGKEAEGLVITIGNTVAAMGGSQEMFQSITRALGQMRTRGKITAQEMMQLSEAGVPALQILQEELNLTADQVSNIGDAGIDAATGIDALAKGLDKRFGGALEAQSKTALGLISTLKDNFLLLSAALAQPVFEPMKNALKGITDIMGQLAARSQEIGLLEAIREEAPQAARLIESVMSTFRALSDVVRGLMPGIRELFTVLGKTTGAAALATFTALAEVLQAIAKVVEMIPDDVQRLVATFIALNLVTRRLAFVGTMFTAIGKGIQGVIRQAIAFKAVMEALRVEQGMSRSAAAVDTLGIAMTKTAGKATMMSKAMKFSGGGWVLALTAAATAATLLFDVFSRGDDQTNDVADATEVFGAQLADSTAQILAQADAIERLKRSMTEGELGYVSMSDAIIESLVSQETAEEDLEHRAVDITTQLGKAGLVVNDLAQLVTILDRSTAGASAALLELGFSQEEINSVLGDGATAIDVFTEKLNIDPGSAQWRALSDAIKMVQESMRAGDIDAQAMTQGFIDQARGASQLTQDLVAQAEAMAESTGQAHDATAVYLNYILLASRLGDEQRGLAMDLDAARRSNAQTNDEMEEGAEKSEKLTKNLDHLKRQAEETAQAFEELKGRASEVQSSFDSFTDAGQVFSGVFDDVTDAGKEAAENAALNAGLSAESWEQFASEAGLSLSSFADALEAQIIAQQRWGENLLTIAQTYGPQVASELRELGPEAAGIVQQMVDDTSGEAARLADLLKADAATGSDELAVEWQAGMDALAAIIENPEIDPNTLADNLGVPLSGLEGVIQKYGGDHGREYLNKFQSQFSKSKVTFSTSQVVVTGSPVKIPAIINVSQRGTANPLLQADGGFVNVAKLWSFANGGLKPEDTLPNQATIERRGRTLVQWAEPETGGEAFIPLSPQKRNRSLQIWMETGRMLGAVGFGKGGFLSFANGGPFGTAGTPKPRAAQQGLGSSLPTAVAGKSASVAVSASANAAAAKVDWSGVAEVLEEQQSNKFQVELDLADAPRQMELLMGKIAELSRANKEWTNEWVDLQRQRGDAMEAFVETVRAAGDSMVELVEEERDLRQELVDIQLEALEERQEAQEDYDKSIIDLGKDTARRRTELEEGFAEDTVRINEDLARDLQSINDELTEQVRQRSDAFFSSINAMENFRAQWGSTTASVTANLKQQNAAFRDYNASLEQLKQRGATEDVIEALGLGDVSSMDQVRQLLSSTPEEFQALLDEVAERRRQADVLAQNNRRDLDREAETQRAEAQANAAEAAKELRDRFNKDLQTLLADQAVATQELHAQLQETFADINDNMLENQSEVQQELAALGMDTGLTYGEALKAGMESALPGVKEAAAYYAAELAKLMALAQSQGGNVVAGTTPESILAQFGISLPPPASSTTTPPPGPPSGQQQYTIQRGDSWWSMAQKLWGDGRRYRELANLNGVTNVNAIIRPGQVIKYHSGGVVKGRGDEVLAKLQTGEGVLTRGFMSSLTSGAMFDMIMGRGRFAGVGPAAQFDADRFENSSGEIVVPVTLTLDGEVITKVVTRRQLAARRTAGLNRGDRTSVR